jgi:FkbM family methyltransferase
MGILNFESGDVSGENAFLSMYLKEKPNPIVFDVGANKGNYSKKVFTFNPKATVYAFEPHPLIFKRLVENIKYPSFYPNNYAVGENIGVFSLYDYENNDGSEHASLFKDVIENIHHGKATEHKVNVISLDAFTQTQSIGTIDLLKIDTEGNELNVLKGIVGGLAKKNVKAIHFEFNEMNISSRTYFRDFWDLLPNYRFYRMLPDGLIPIEIYSPLFCEIFAYQNIVALLSSET